MINTHEAWDGVHNGSKSKGAGNLTVKVVAIIGFFVEGMNGDDVVGYLATKPDLLVSNGGAANPQSAFIKAVRLVR